MQTKYDAQALVASKINQKWYLNTLEPNLIDKLFKTLETKSITPCCLHYFYDGKLGCYTRLAEIFAIGSDEEEKTSPRIDCKVNNIDSKALCDIGAQVSVLSSKIFDEIHDHTIDLVPTITKLIMGDGRIVKPIGIAQNLEVLISGKCIPTDFFIVDVYCNDPGFRWGKPDSLYPCDSPWISSYHVQNSLQYNIISIQRNQSTKQNIYT